MFIFTRASNFFVVNTFGLFIISPVASSYQSLFYRTLSAAKVSMKLAENASKF